MKATTRASLERRVRELVTLLPPSMVVKIYSKGRVRFLEKLKDDIPQETFNPPQSLSRTVWGIPFKTPLMNAAGVFKNGEGYEVVARQGAGAYLGGTGTWNARKGNEKNGVHLPFVPLPRSGAAANWLGLPNDGDPVNAERAKKLERIADCPIGWSIMASPDYNGCDKMKYLVEGMFAYAMAGVDFLEINESCPNTSHGSPQEDGLSERLGYIQKEFLVKRQRNLPVIVKFSNDTEVSQVPCLMDLLFENGFDGVNFGNTSVKYSEVGGVIHPVEKKLFNHYTQTFGGGLSGRLLKDSSLGLASRAVEYVKAGPPSQEFHVIRTGGIETFKDVEESTRAGISLNQWFTGYFEHFAKHGHRVYEKLFS